MSKQRKAKHHVSAVPAPPPEPAQAAGESFHGARIVIVQPKGYEHAGAFAEIAEALRAALESLSVPCMVTHNETAPGAINIVLGWHLLTRQQEKALPTGTVLYNLEQLDEKNAELRGRLITLAEHCEIWEYSRRNIEILYGAGFPGVLRHVPVGTVPELTRIAPAAEQDIDVLFYGSLNPRRARILDELKKSGLNVQAVFGVYGAERDALIARAKVVLNLHYYDSNIFEMIRVSYLWSNRKAVVAECALNTEVEAELAEAALFVPYPHLVQACRFLVENPEKRHALEERGYQLMSQRDEAAILRRVLTGEADAPLSPLAEGPSISLVVNTWNEEKNLPGLFASCSGVEEMVVADMESSDRTVEVAREHQARVVTVPVTGERCCEAGRQAALDAARGEWILLLDGDERLSPGGLARLRRLAAAAPQNVSAFSLAFHVLLGNTRVHATGWEPRYERHVRFFRRRRVQWPSHVHAVPQVTGATEQVPEDDVWVVHHNFADLEHFFSKTNRYSSIEARELIAAGKPVSLRQGLHEGLAELLRRYSPEEDGAMSLALSFGILAYKVLNHAKACEAAGWPQEEVPTRAALERAVAAFEHEIDGETQLIRPRGAVARDVAVSIIIPVFNKVEYTEKCIASLREHTPGELYELIVVDNASSDGTAHYLASLGDAAQVITNAENRGFVGACNEGAAAARGRYLLFLNNDTTLNPGWLEALLRIAEGDATVGAVGAKLVYPDGRLQEAGGMIFQDGSGWNFGRFDDPAKPQYNQPYEVDYCSGAALLVRRKAFEALGGFDARYAPAYYEDTDLCFGLRSIGLKVMFCPGSVVTHYEGITAGNDLNSGYKQYQVVNHEKFVAKWADALRQQDPPPTRTGRAPATSDRARLSAPQAFLPPAAPGATHVLIVDPLMPMFDVASGSLRLFRIIQLFRVLGCHVTFIARNGNAHPRYRQQLEALGVAVYAGDRAKMLELGYPTNFPEIDLKKLLRERPCQLAWLSFYYIGEQYLKDIRRASPETVIAIDTVDVHFLREKRQAELAQDAAARKQAESTRARELAIYSKADLVLTVTDNDAAVLRENGLTVPTCTIPNVHSAEHSATGFHERKDLLFIGNFNHPPNADAVLWFCREILPLVRERIPGVRLRVVGANPPQAVQQLNGDAVQVVGWVPETASHLDAARVSVAPLRVGAGMKGKVGEALARGIPVVATSIAAEGMGLVHGEHALVADDPVDFADAVVHLYNNEQQWLHMAAAGREYVESRYGLRAVMHLLHGLLESATNRAVPV